MKTILSLCIFLIIAFSKIVKACDCPGTERDTLVYRNLKHADIVFLGEAIKIDTSSKFYQNKGEKYSHQNPFTFKILELFKGNNLGKKTINGASFNNCCISPIEIGQFFIVFAKFENDSLISMSYCDNTISLDINGDEPPIFNNASRFDSIKYELSYLKSYPIKRIIDWNYCLEKLRDYKRSIEEKSKIKVSFWKNKLFQIGLIGTNILLLILLFYKKMK